VGVILESRLGFQDSELRNADLKGICFFFCLQLIVEFEFRLLAVFYFLFLFCF
jgi:hypothetical protein